MKSKILITGATGRIGSELVRLYIQRGITVRVATRNPTAIASNLSASTEIVEFDYEKPKTFAPALKGIEKVFLVARPGDNHSDKAVEPFIEEAIKSNVKHIVNLTAMGVETDNSFILRILEKTIEDSGIQFTHLRPNWFMQNFNNPPFLNEILSTGKLRLPAGDAKVSFIDVRDIATAAYTILNSDLHLGKAYTLTGKESLNYYDVFERLSVVTGKKFEYVPVSEETAHEGLIKRGVPSGLIERWIGFYRKVRQGFCSPVIEDLELIIGRMPILFDQYAKDFSGSWM